MDLDKLTFTSTIEDDVETLVCSDKNAYLAAAEDVVPSDTVGTVRLFTFPEAVDKVFKHNETYIDETAKAATDLSVGSFKNKKVNKVIVDFPFGPTGSGSVTYKIDRERSFPVPTTEKGGKKKIVKKPHIVQTLKHQSLKTSKSKMKKFEDVIKTSF